MSAHVENPPVEYPNEDPVEQQPDGDPPAPIKEEQQKHPKQPPPPPPVFPSDLVEDLPGEKVLSLPAQVRGMLLCGEIPDLSPTQEVGNVIKLFLWQEKAFISRKSHFTVTKVAGDNNNTDDEQGVQATMDGTHRLIHQRCFVLKDHEGIPQALCLRERNVLHRAYKIYGRHPLCHDDEPETTEADMDFYPWFRIASYNMGPSENRCISVWTGKAKGSHYEPLLGIHVTGIHGKECVVISSLVVKHHQHDIIAPEDEPPAHNEVHRYAVLKHVHQNRLDGWAAAIAPGVDPGLILCAAAVIQDYVASFPPKGLPEHFRETNHDEDFPRD